MKTNNAIRYTFLPICYTFLTLVVVGCSPIVVPEPVFVATNQPAETPVCLIVVADVLNLRSGATTSAEVLDWLVYGTILVSLESRERAGGWWYVTANSATIGNVSGFVKSEYVKECE